MNLAYDKIIELTSSYLIAIAQALGYDNVNELKVYAAPNNTHPKRNTPGIIYYTVHHKIKRLAFSFRINERQNLVVYARVVGYKEPAYQIRLYISSWKRKQYPEVYDALNKLVFHSNPNAFDQDYYQYGKYLYETFKKLPSQTTCRFKNLRRLKEIRTPK